MKLKQFVKALNEDWTKPEATIRDRIKNVDFSKFEIRFSPTEKKVEIIGIASNGNRKTYGWSNIDWDTSDLKEFGEDCGKNKHFKGYNNLIPYNGSFFTDSNLCYGFFLDKEEDPDMVNPIELMNNHFKRQNIL